MNLEKITPAIGWCSVCRGTFQTLIHLDPDGADHLNHVCGSCAKELFDNE